MFRRKRPGETGELMLRVSSKAAAGQAKSVRSDLDHGGVAS